MMISIRIVSSICTFCDSCLTLLNKGRKISLVVIIYSLGRHLFFTIQNQLTSFPTNSHESIRCFITIVFFARLKTKSYPTPGEGFQGIKAS